MNAVFFFYVLFLLRMYCGAYVNFCVCDPIFKSIAFVFELAFYFTFQNVNACKR